MLYCVCKPAVNWFCFCFVFVLVFVFCLFFLLSSFIYMFTICISTLRLQLVISRCKGKISFVFISLSCEMVYFTLRLFFQDETENTNQCNKRLFVLYERKTWWVISCHSCQWRRDEGIEQSSFFTFRCNFSQNAHFNEILISFFMPFNTNHCFKMNPVNWMPLCAADVAELSTPKEN